MYECKLIGMPDINWIQVEKENCLCLFSPRDYLILPNQMLVMDFECNYKLSKGVVGIPFLDKKIISISKLNLYYPNFGFKWEGKNRAQVAFINKTQERINIAENQLVCKINLMTIQYFNLMRRKDNSDKGLRSSHIKIELLYGKENCNGE